MLCVIVAGMPDPTHTACQELLQAMVGFNTVNPGVLGQTAPTPKYLSFLKDWAETEGLASQELPIDAAASNLLVHEPNPGDRPWLLFESHMDTVSVEGMSIDPFAGEIRDGRLWGRGACDTKGTGAAMLWALKQHLANGGGPNNIAILFTTDEEISKTGIVAFTNDQLPGLGWRPAAAVVGEPTLLRPVVAHNGLVRWKMRTEGLAAHSGTPERGRSAIRMMMPVIEAMEAEYIAKLTAEHPLTGRAKCSINIIRGGSQINVIPADCEISIDRRVVPGENAQTVMPEIERIMRELCSREPDTELHIDPPVIDPPLDTTGSEAFASQVGDVLENEGLDSTGIGVGWTSEGSDFMRAGIPVVVIGPGSIDQAHQADECIELEQLDLGVQVYQALMKTPLE